VGPKDKIITGILHGAANFWNRVYRESIKNSFDPLTIDLSVKTREVTGADQPNRIGRRRVLIFDPSSLIGEPANCDAATLRVVSPASVRPREQGILTNDARVALAEHTRRLTAKWRRS
jgi:hypothetical protein